MKLSRVKDPTTRASDHGPWSWMLRRTISSSFSSPSAILRAFCDLRSLRNSSVSFSLSFRTVLTSRSAAKSGPADWLPDRFLQELRDPVCRFGIRTRPI